MKTSGLFLLSAFVVVLLSVSLATPAGFDQWGYNRTARIFVGTGMNWCLGKGLDYTWCVGYLGPYAGDQIVMKWNKEWDRGNAENWSNPPYDAWTDNEWNGQMPGGSGSVWHYKFVWVGPCINGTTLSNGGYCIWGQFEVLMDQGIDPSYGPGHFFYSKAIPNGYGYYPLFP